MSPVPPVRGADQKRGARRREPVQMALSERAGSSGFCRFDVPSRPFRVVGTGLTDRRAWMRYLVADIRCPGRGPVGRRRVENDEKMAVFFFFSNGCGGAGLRKAVSYFPWTRDDRGGRGKGA